MKYHHYRSFIAAAAALLGLAFVAVFPAQAALKVNINRSSDSAIPIAIPPFGASQGQVPVDVAKIAGNDLASTGLFKLFPRGDMLEKPSKPDQVHYDNWRTQNVDNLVVGSVSSNDSSGYKIDFHLLDVPQEKTVSGYQVKAGHGQLEAAGHTVANIVYKHFTGYKGYFLSRIAYVTVTGRSLDNRRYRLVVADYDGSHPSTVYSSHDPIMSPAWSPDGTKLAYVAFNVEKGLSVVQVQNLKTGKVRTITSSGGVNGAPAWSPDGHKLALAKSTNGNTNLYVYNLQTNQLHQLTNGSGIDTGPSWSADGNTIAFASSRGGQPQIYEISSNGGHAQRLTYDGKSNQRPQFSPDGKSLAMVRRSGNGYRIAVMDLSNNNVHIVSSGPLDDSPHFAPNGQAIIYAEQGKRNALVVVSLDGSTKSTLSQAGDIRSPAWGPFAQ